MVAQRCLMEASGILKKKAVISSQWFLDTSHYSRGISEVLRLILILIIYYINKCKYSKETKQEV